MEFLHFYVLQIKATNNKQNLYLILDTPSKLLTLIIHMLYLLSNGT
jgi:hypothetical protein